MPLTIAFVACNKNAACFRQDPAFIYRCENLSVALGQLGHSTRLLHLTDLSWRDRFDVVVFHRPRLNWRLRAALSLLRRTSAVLVADFDDLVFDEKLVSYNPGVLNRQVPERGIRRLYRSHRRALDGFDKATVSTAPLAEELGRRCPALQVAVLPNAVHHSWLGAPLPDRRDRATKVITYFPGTRSHDRDFKVAAPALERFLAQHPDVRLAVTGPLTFQLKVSPEQVYHQPKVPFAEFGRLFVESWINLAPLEDTPFTRCKSALKVLEAGFWGVPTLCTPIPDCQRFVGGGAISVTAAEDWYQRLNDLVDPMTYNNRVKNLRQKTLEQACVGHVAEQFLNFVGQGG